MANIKDIDGSSGGYLKELGEIATKLHLPMAQTNDLIDLISNDMLRSIYRYPPKVPNPKGGSDIEGVLSEEDKEFNQKVDAVHREWNNGAPFPPYRRNKVRGTSAAGSPGHGKTTVFEVAAERVARAMNMRFLNPIDLEHVPLEEINKNTFVFISEETAGMISAMEFFGMPSEGRTANGTRYMGRLFTLQLQKLMKAGAGVCLLDDFSNAHEHIQDVGLSLVDRRRNGELILTNTYFGVTGNLGGLDDTNAKRMSAALRGRMRTYLVHDTVENFLNRLLTNPKYQDELGSAFLRPFFLRTKDRYFSAIPLRGKQGGFPSPRTWLDAMEETRDALHRHGGRDGAAAARYDIKNILEASVGLECASAFDTFMEAVLLGAEPLAAELISTGKVNETKFKAAKSEGGFTPQDMFFENQFALALVDHTINKILKDKSLKEGIERFGKGLGMITDDASFELALEELQTRMVIQIPEMDGIKIGKLVNADQGRYELETEAGNAIGTMIMKATPVDETRRRSIINVFSDMNKQDRRVDVPTAKGRSR